MTAKQLGLTLAGAAFYVALPGSAAGQLQPAPPAPTWRPGMENDPRYRERHAFISEDQTEVIVRYRPEPEPRQPHPPDVAPAPEVIIQAKIRNRLAPEVRVRVGQRPSGYYRYAYEVRNRNTAQEAITFWDLVVPDGIENPTSRGRWGRPSLALGPPRERQILAPGAPPGRGLAWFPDRLAGDRPIAPGEAAEDFLLDSLHRPGFVVATFSDDAAKVLDWPEVDRDRMWSDSVTRELDPLLRWVLRRNKVLTIGPVFRPGEDPVSIAKELESALDKLGEMNEIDLASPSVSEARTRLHEIARNASRSGLSLKARPSTDHEEDLAQILRLSLHISLESGTGSK